MTHEITTVDGDLGNFLQQNFLGIFPPNYIKVDGFILRDRYRKFVDTIENFEVRDDDIWICAFPKTGTTWTQEMIWCIANDLDFEQARVPLMNRFPLLEFCIFDDSDAIQQEHPNIELPNIKSGHISYIEKLSSPRFIKTHLPFHLLPRQIRTGEKTPKIISVFRNVKDVCVSYYHFHVLLAGYHGNFDDFCKLFLGDSLLYTPYWTNVLSYWQKRIQDNVLILKYEDMKKDLPSTIKKTAKFLDKNLTSEQVSSLNEHLSFANMKENPAVNNKDHITFCKGLFGHKQDTSFIRSGTTGQWKLEMNSEFVKQFDDWSRHHLKDTDPSFFEIIE